MNNIIISVSLALQILLPLIFALLNIENYSQQKSAFWSIFGGSAVVVSTFLNFFVYHIIRSDFSLKDISLNIWKSLLISLLPLTIIGLIYLLVSTNNSSFEFQGLSFIKNIHYYFAIGLIVLLSLYLFILRSIIGRRSLILSKLNGFLENLYLCKNFQHIQNQSKNNKYYNSFINRLLDNMIQIVTDFSHPFKKFGHIVSDIRKTPFIVSAWLYFPNEKNNYYDIPFYVFSQSEGYGIYDGIINEHRPIFHNMRHFNQLKNKLSNGKISQEKFNEEIIKYTSTIGYFTYSKARAYPEPRIYPNTKNNKFYDDYKTHIGNEAFYFRSLIFIPLFLSGTKHAGLFIFSNSENYFSKNVYQYLQPLSLLLMSVLKLSKIKNVKLG